MIFRAKNRGAKRPSLLTAMAMGMAVLATIAGFVAPSAAAEPAAAPAATSAAASFCTTGTVQAKVNGRAYSGWESYRIVGAYFRLENYSCNGYEVGRYYGACGGGNVWLLAHIWLGTGKTWGYVPSNCFWNQ